MLTIDKMLAGFSLASMLGGLAVAVVLQRMKVKFQTLFGNETEQLSKNEKPGRAVLRTPQQHLVTQPK